MRTPAAEGLDVKLRALKLPSFIAHHSEVGGQAEKGGWNFDRYLNELTEIELEDRRRRRIEKLLKASALPSDKTLATLDVSRLPTPVRRQLPTLCEGGFVDRTENLLAFGLTGRGKTHLMSAIGHELVQRGYRVVFIAAFRLVQHLLTAKRDLKLEAEVRRLIITSNLVFSQWDRIFWTRWMP